MGHLFPLLLSLQSLLLAAKLAQCLGDSGAFTNPGRATLEQLEIESEWTAIQREREAGTLCEADLLPENRTQPSMISYSGKGGAMSRGKHTEAQMIGALKQVEAGRRAEDVARELGVSKHTIYAWKAKYGGMDASEAQEAKQLRDENTRLRKLVADLSLDKEMLKAVIVKNGLRS